MSSNDSLSLQVGVKGEKEFRNALSQITAQSKALKSEMNLVASSFDSGASAQKKAKAQVEVLSKQFDTQQKKVDLLKEKYQKYVDAEKESSTEALKLKDALNKAETELNKTKDALDDAKTASSKFKTKLEELKDSAGDKLKSALKGVGTVTADVAKGIGVAAAAIGTAVVKIAKDAVSAYAETEQLRGGIETLFADSADAVIKNANNAFKTAGMSANDYMETVTGFSASLISSLSGDTVKAAEMADMAITDMSDNANKMGSDISSIQSAYAGFAKGQYTLLDNLKLGYGGTKTEMERLLADATKFSHIEYDISSYADIVDAIHVIQTEMGITNTTAEEASTTISGSIGAMKSAYENFVSGLADKNADIKSLVENLIQSAMTVVKNIIPIISNVLTNLVGAIKEIIPQIIAVLPSMLTDLLPPLLDTVEVALTAISEELPNLIDTILDFVVNKLIPKIIEMIPSLMETMQKVVMSIIDTITKGDNLTKLVNSAIELIITLAKGLISAIPQLVSRIPQIITAIVNALKSGLGKIGEVGGNLIRGLWAGISDKVEWIKTKIKGFGTTVLNSIKSIFGIHSPSAVMRDVIGKNLMLGMAQGISKNGDAAVDAMLGVSDEIMSAATGLGNIQTSVAIGGNSSLVSAFTQALEGCSVTMNGKEMGKFVTNTVRKAVYA